MSDLERALRDLDCEFDPAARFSVGDLQVALVFWACAKGVSGAATYFDGEGRKERRALRRDLTALGVWGAGSHSYGLRVPPDLRMRFRNVS